MKRREVTTGLVAAGLTLPLILRSDRAEAGGGDGPTIITKLLVFALLGVIVNPLFFGVILRGANPDFRAIPLNRRMKYETNGNSMLQKAHRGQKVADIFWINNMLIAAVIANVVIPNKGIFIVGNEAFYPSKRLKGLDVGWAVTYSAVVGGTLVGALWVYGNYWYAVIQNS